MMMGGKGSSAASSIVQAFYSANNGTTTPQQMQITGIASADRASGLVWIIMISGNAGTKGGIGPIAGETQRWDDSIVGPAAQVFTYVTDGTEFNYLNTQYSDWEYATLSLWVLDPSITTYGSESVVKSGSITDITFNSVTTDSADDVAVALMFNADGVGLNTVDSAYSPLDGPEGTGSGQGFASRWALYLYYKDGGLGNPTHTGPTGFAWASAMGWESLLMTFRRL